MFSFVSAFFVTVMVSGQLVQDDGVVPGRDLPFAVYATFSASLLVHETESFLLPASKTFVPPEAMNQAPFQSLWQSQVNFNSPLASVPSR